MTEKTKKIAEYLKEELAFLVAKELDVPKSVVVTLTDLEMSDDLSWAKVFVLVFPPAETRRALFLLNQQSHQFHQILDKRLRLRRIPKMNFIEEAPKKVKSTNQLERLDSILDRLGGKYSAE